MNMPSLNSVVFASTLAVIAALGLLLAPFTDNFVFESKYYLFILFTLCIAIVFALRSFGKKSFTIIASPITTPLLLLSASAALSSFATSPYPVEHLLGLGGALIAFGIVAVLGASLLPKNTTDALIAALWGSSIVVFFAAVAQALGFGPAQAYNALFGFEIPTGDFLFNLTGSSFIAAQLTLVALVGLIAKAVNTKHISTSTAIAAPLLIIALAVYGWHLLPGKPASVTVPPFTASWSIALDVIRFPQSALIGVGPAGYSNTYNQFKPAWINAQEDWAISYGQATNTPFTILTTLGFIGLAAWIFLAYRTIKLWPQVNKENQPILILILTLLALQLVTTLNIVLIAILAVLYAALIAAERHKLPVLQLQALSAKMVSRRTFDTQQALQGSLGGDAARAVSAAAQDESMFKRALGSINAFALLLLVASVASIYLTGRAYASQATMSQANRAQNDIITAYRLQEQAVNLNPYLDSHRRQFALSNLYIALAISQGANESAQANAQANEGQGDAQQSQLTQQEEQQIAELLQVAIAEARSATILDPRDVQNWIALAQIYENMIGVSEDAAEWTVQAYVNAVEAHPTDPSLRVALGSVFLQQEQFAQAATFFEQATNLKPDFANGYYNLGFALEQLNQLPQALASYQAVLQLLEPDSEDYIAVLQQVERLQEQVAELQAQQQLEGADGQGFDTQGGQFQGGAPAGMTDGSPLGSQLEAEGGTNQGTTNPSILEENLNLQQQDPIQPRPGANLEGNETE